MRPSITVMRNTPTSRPIRTPLGEYLMVRSRGVTAHLKMHRYFLTAQHMIPGCGKISRCTGRYTARKKTKTRKKFEEIGSTRPRCCCSEYDVLLESIRSSTKPVSAPPVMPPIRTLTNTHT